MTEEEKVDIKTGEIHDDTQHFKQPVEIIGARLSVMKDATSVGKSGENKFHHYKYASDKDVLGLVQPLLAKHGLTLDMWPVNVRGPDDNGNMWVKFMMQWHHESGVSATPIPWYGIAQDRDKQGNMGDKWFNKAATAAEKYFFLKQFHIPAGEDMDPDASTQENNPPYKAPKKAPPKKAEARKPEPKQEEPEENNSLDKVPTDDAELTQLVETLVENVEEKNKPLLKTPEGENWPWTGAAQVMIKFSEFHETNEELVRFWQINAGVMDRMKEEAPKLYEKVLAHFTKRRRETKGS